MTPASPCSFTEFNLLTPDPPSAMIRESEEHVFNPDTGERVGGAATAHTSV